MITTKRRPTSFIHMWATITKVRDVCTRIGHGYLGNVMATSGIALDLVVVGGGMRGPATAVLAQRLGLRVALLESHTKLGGCAAFDQASHSGPAEVVAVSLTSR